ncbi:MAG TPA: DUF305 domain-containing protein [Gemmatimonadales bacterium]|nr:DUF305 domain-containing protein [Gemmatimonadales bacterium]
MRLHRSFYHIMTATLPLALAGAPAASAQAAVSPADVHFMSGMIYHHAQAVVMAGWAPTHGASQTIQTLCARILVSQNDEIAMMQQWLRDRHQEVPDPASHPMAMMMPGMLSPEQLAQLDSARGPEFDRWFLTFMIQHHQGAITMVNELLATPGAAQDGQVFRFSADVSADQTAEIGRMQKILNSLPTGGKNP